MAATAVTVSVLAGAIYASVTVSTTTPVPMRKLGLSSVPMAMVVVSVSERVT